jgi:glycosyltransferase involved in cell wall biosynthesis
MIAKMNSIFNVRSLPSQRMTVLKQMRQNRPQISKTTKQLLVDVSVIIREDAHTGIQRVVRALLLQLFSNPPEGYQVLPVFCTRKHDYRYADSLFVRKFTSCSDKLPTGDVVVGNKDIFFALDLAAHLLPLHENQLLAWKQQGVKIHILIYDMLPHLHSQWFTPRSVKNFRRWLQTIGVYADQLICISETVKNELRTWLFDQGFSANTPRISTIPMGSEIASSLPSSGADTETIELIERLKNEKFILMVGTIEPRKGYADAIDAMEVLWDNNDQTSLVIVGKPGWKTLKLQERLLTHEQAGKKLFWLKNISDQTLQKLYEMANGVLVASYGEGFGLPIVEAMHYGKSLLVRDIPVFREVAGNYEYISFFPNNTFIVEMLSDLRISEKKDLRSEVLTWNKASSVLIHHLIASKSIA